MAWRQFESGNKRWYNCVDGSEVLWSVCGQTGRYKLHVNRTEVEMLVPVPGEAIRYADAVEVLLGV